MKAIIFIAFVFLSFFFCVLFSFVPFPFAKDQIIGFDDLPLERGAVPYLQNNVRDRLVLFIFTIMS